MQKESMILTSEQSQKKNEDGDAILANRDSPTRTDTPDYESTTQTVEATVHQNLENND